MARKTDKSSKRNQLGAGLAAAVIAGGLAVLFALGRRASDGAGIGGSSAADLGLDQPHHGPDDRASDDFRPDATADIPADRRDAFAPATMPNPMSAEPVV